MLKAKFKKLLVGSLSLCTTVLILTSFVVPFTLSAYVKDADSEGFYGEVSLRSYFECGSGRPKGTLGIDDPGDPYVITRPRHLYNLSRLQGLGVFGENTFFQLGLVGLNGDLSGEPLCYLDDSSSTVVPFLDMSDSDYSYEPINAIGSEAVPFYGEFDGQNLEIKNLEVFADPQDAGLFGYTAHGSNVHNLFLSEVTINALGYTDSYEGLYGASSLASVDTAFSYIVGTDDSTSDTFVPDDTSKIKLLEFDASDIFDWDGTGAEPVISTPAPIIGNASTNDSYRYKILISGDFLTETNDGTGNVKVDLPTIYKFFKTEKTDADSFPLQASSSISLVASTTDNYGLDHSVVVMTMVFDVSLGAADSDILQMYVHLGSNHQNNIGLVIGHCDGSVSDCYVYNGHFKMNNGNALTGNEYHSMENGSNYGLIGLVGGTVHNIAAEESDAGTKIGKDIGVLDFSTVYNDIIDSSSFTGSTSVPAGGVTYTPKAGTDKYTQYLRNNGTNYVTKEADSVSFNRQKIISNADLGIFTIATDQTGSGMYDDASNGLENSVVKKEDLAVSGSYYVYYATGEYDKDYGIDFAEYRDSINSDNPSLFYPAHHFPNYDQISTESFNQRDRHQNYIVRFQVDGNYRTGRGFYFSDVDKTKPGGSFMSHYFENKLVDQNGHTIPASSNSGKSGVMLRNSIGQEIRSFNASFATPDLSHAAGASIELKPKMFCIENGSVSDESKNPAANMVNFEVKTEVANVTIVAGLNDLSKAAALGIYKVETSDKTTYDGHLYIDKDFEDPDYAFFMPTDNQLAYFDYKVTRVGNDDVGQIGVYDTFGNFAEANTNTDATVPKTYNYGTEYGYAASKTRLYAHTFKLPRGHYCVGSATGTHRGNNVEGTAKIYYLCAQGQTDGHISFDDNAFASRDEVKNIDFTKVERFSYSAGVVTENITIPEEPVSAITPGNQSVLDNQRCYVALTNSDRSMFDDAACNIDFEYDDSDDTFYVTTNTIGAVSYIAVSNYGRIRQQTVTGITPTPVSLFGEASSTDDKITYPSSS